MAYVEKRCDFAAVRANLGTGTIMIKGISLKTNLNTIREMFFIAICSGTRGSFILISFVAELDTVKSLLNNELHARLGSKSSNLTKRPIMQKMGFQSRPVLMTIKRPHLNLRL